MTDYKPRETNKMKIKIKTPYLYWFSTDRFGGVTIIQNDIEGTPIKNCYLQGDDAKQFMTDFDATDKIENDDQARLAAQNLMGAFSEVMEPINA